MRENCQEPDKRGRPRSFKPQIKERRLSKGFIGGPTCGKELHFKIPEIRLRGPLWPVDPQSSALVRDNQLSKYKSSQSILPFAMRYSACIGPLPSTDVRCAPLGNLGDWLRHPKEPFA